MQIMGMISIFFFFRETRLHFKEIHFRIVLSGHSIHSPTLACGKIVIEKNIS